MKRVGIVFIALGVIAFIIAVFPGFMMSGSRDVTFVSNIAPMVAPIAIFSIIFIAIGIVLLVLAAIAKEVLHPQHYYNSEGFLLAVGEVITAEAS